MAFIGACDAFKLLQRYKIQGDAKSDNPSRQSGRAVQIRKACMHVVPSHALSVTLFVAFFRPSELGMQTSLATAPTLLSAAATLL